MIKIAPSILAADPLKLGTEVQKMVDAGCDMLHVDIMDGHFVPNMSFGPAMTEAIHKQFNDLKLDVHLMIDNPEKYLKQFADSGAWNITIHAEVPGDVAGMLKQIREMGVKAGISIKPDTPVHNIAPLLELCDMILIMTVEPGFGGQNLRPELIEKLAQLRKMGYTGLLEADGGIKLQHLPDMKAKGLDVAVMGTTLYRSQTLEADMRYIHSL